MTLPRRDLIATVLVGVAGLVYVLWLAGEGPGGRVVAAIVLAMGFAASAVVPAFTDLLHSSKIYLAVTSTLGLLALAAGIVALAAGSSAMLAILAITTVVLWALATIRHQRMRSRTNSPPPAQPRSSRRPPPSVLRHT
jgi:hypothetical protein